MAGLIERIGLPEATLRVMSASQTEGIQQIVPAPDHAEAVRVLMKWIDEQDKSNELTAVGHRVVHGWPIYSTPQQITAAMVKEFHRLSPFDPEHLPADILLIEAFHRRFPLLPQVACFDTAFYHNLPCVARLLLLPRHSHRRRTNDNRDGLSSLGTCH